MTQVFQIPAQPAIIPAAQYIRPEVLATYENIYAVPYALQAMETVMVYIDPSGNITHLTGPQEGLEGVRLGEQIQGEQHWPFEQVISESAYQLGATIERTNFLMRKINFRVLIGAPGMSNILYRACEDRWWSGQDEVNGGWFGVFTRFSGWRWIQVFPEKTVDTAQKRDPVAFQNHMAIWDINWIAPIPYYSQPAAVSQPWFATNAGPPDKNGFFHGKIALPNRGEIGSYVEYLINGTGSAIVQDNDSDRYVQIPEIQASDGQVLCDTDPTHRTLIAVNDPMDNLFANILRGAGLLNFFLINTPNPSGDPIWLRGYTRFLYVVRPQTVVHLHVAHTNPNASIVAKLTTRFKRSR